MYSTSYGRASARPPAGTRRTTKNGLSVATSEEDGYELTIRPSSSSSSSGSRASKNSGSSRNSFRNPFRRQNSNQRKQPKPPSVILPPKPSQLPVSSEATQTEQLSPPVELRLQLLPRIAEYKQRKWINASEEREYMQLLADQPVNFENPTDNPAIQVKQALDLVEKQEEAKTRHGHNARQVVIAPPPQQKHERSVVLSPKKNLPTKSFNSQTKPLSDNSRTRHPMFQEKKLIVNPAELCATNVEEQFVEMCFFARLGFIQPPSCMRCVYRESMNDCPPDPSCQRWVAWRKNAKTHLHPHQLAGNIIMVKCHAARSLVDGETVQGYEWDSAGKILISRTDEN